MKKFTKEELTIICFLAGVVVYKTSSKKVVFNTNPKALTKSIVFGANYHKDDCDSFIYEMDATNDDALTLEWLKANVENL